jgi:dihydroxyacetone kinase-like protein
MESFPNLEGSVIVTDLVQTIQENKEFLSEIDGLIGDGDHGINMNKGFTECGTKLSENPGDLSYSLRVLSQILMGNIGGSMGPLYGMFFRAMAKESAGQERIDAERFGIMLEAAVAKVQEIGGAKAGDKTLLDTLLPAVAAYRQALNAGANFATALEKMKRAAVDGRDSTKEMVAKVGRSSRLGERSRGVIDAGAASSCLILCSMADSIQKLLNK